MKSEYLPQNWSVVRLGDLAAEGPSNGYSGPTSDTAMGTKTLRLSATTQGFMILNQDTTKRLIENIPKDSNYWLQPGDLLVQRSNTLEYLGASAIYEGKSNQYIYPDLMMRLRFSDPATTRWVWRFLNTRIARRYFQKVAGGTAGSMPKISGAKLKELQISLPPLEEQRRIAAILDRADAVRRKRQEAIALTEELLRSTFLEMFGDPATNPKGWEIKKFRDVCERIFKGAFDLKASLYQDSGIPFIRISNIQNGTIDLSSSVFISEEALASYKEYCVFPGDLVFSKVGTIDRIGVVPQSVSIAVISQNNVGVKLKSEVMSSDFALAYLMTDYSLSQIRATSKKAVQDKLVLSELRELSIPVPPLKYQEEFSKAQKDIKAIQSKLQKNTVYIDHLFTSLFQRAFQGKL